MHVWKSLLFNREIPFEKLFSKLLLNFPNLTHFFRLKQADRFCDSSFKQKQLWELLDKRRQQKVYQNQTVCRGMNVLIVGAGPCGLRAAIECALLGAQVVVVDSRDKFTRNNVLHLWKFVIEDLRGLGAKIFMPKFCTGSIEHIVSLTDFKILISVPLLGHPQTSVHFTQNRSCSWCSIL